MSTVTETPEDFLARVYASGSESAKNTSFSWQRDDPYWDVIVLHDLAVKDLTATRLHLSANRPRWRLSKERLFQLGELSILDGATAYEVARRFSGIDLDILSAVEIALARAAEKPPMGAFLMMVPYYWWFGSDYAKPGTQQADFKALAEELIRDRDLCLVAVNLLAGLLRSKEGYCLNTSSSKVLEVVELARRVIS